MHWNFGRILDGRMLADPALRTLVSRHLATSAALPKRIDHTSVFVAARCLAHGPALLATDRQVRPAVTESIGHRMSGEPSEYTSEQAMRGRA